MSAPTGALLRPGGRNTRFLIAGAAADDGVIESHYVSAGRLADRLGLADRVVARPRITPSSAGTAAACPAARAATPSRSRCGSCTSPTSPRCTSRTAVAAAAIGSPAPQRHPVRPGARRGVLPAPSTRRDPAGDDAWRPSSCARITTGGSPRTSSTNALTAMGDFVDLKSPVDRRPLPGGRRARRRRGALSWASARGRRRAAPRRAGARPRADGGVRTGLGQADAASSAERERVRLHPYLTAAHPGPGRPASPVAAWPAPTANGSTAAGYPQGLAGAELRLPERILAAADAYRSLLEPDPLAGPVEPEEAARVLRADVQAGRLDGRRSRPCSPPRASRRRSGSAGPPASPTAR